MLITTICLIIIALVVAVAVHGEMRFNREIARITSGQNADGSMSREQRRSTPRPARSTTRPKNTARPAVADNTSSYLTTHAAIGSFDGGSSSCGGSSSGSSGGFDGGGGGCDG